jgi:Uma2 family endonuclease
MTLGMTTNYKPAIDFSTFPDSDGEPMAENDANRIQMSDLIFALQRLMADRDDVYVGGNLLVYYNPANGWDHLSPDVLVAFGVRSGLRHSWRTWIEGKFPDVVFEITSPSTEDVDRGRKMEQYAVLGAREYYIFDPEASMRPAFRGHHIVDGRFAGLAVEASGGIVSPLLGLELRPVDSWLRVINPESGSVVPIPSELDALLRATSERAALELRARRAAEERTKQETQARQEAEERTKQETQARRAAEERTEQETRARRAAEERAASAEAELQALRAAIARSTGTGTPPA